MIYHLLTEEEPFSEIDGGAISRWVANMATSRDHMVVCVSSDDSWGFPSQRIIHLDRLRYFRARRQCHLVRITSPFSRRFARWLFSPLIQELNSGDVLWIHNRPEHAAELAVPLKARGVHTVLHLHNSLSRQLTGVQIREMKNLPVVFCSQYLANEAKQVYSGALEQTYVLHNGADEKLFFPHTAGHASGDTTPNVLYVGRLVPHKGPHVLAEAMRLLQESGTEATCTIYGCSFFGNCKPTRYMRKLLKTRPENVRFEGYLSGPSLARQFRNADIFCCPSTWNEPFGMVNIEAMASGVPVIASNVGGIPEALKYGGGVLVSANDSAALAGALRDLIVDRRQRDQLGVDGLNAFREHFSWTKIQEQYRLILDAITV